MRVVVQRVKSASVEVEGKLISAIQPGLLCYVGLGAGDTAKDADLICKKLLKARLWAGASSGKAWDEDVVAQKKEILCISNFTLHARLKKPRPDFSKAMPPQMAKEQYEAFVAKLREQYEADKVKDGVFGAMMDVTSVNDGPVTLILDSEVEQQGP